MIIKSIKASNFQRYDSIELDNLDQYRNIEIVAGNGAGKSALLETIAFALYGEGRTKTASELVKRGAKGTEVEIEFVDKNRTIKVTRQRKAESSTGAACFYIDNDLKGKGSEVEKAVQDFCGTDYDSFLLTSFFGLHKNDSLMNSLPSARLDFLQTLAQVDIFEKINGYVKEQIADVREKRQLALDFIGATVEFDYSEKELSSKKKRLEEIESEIVGLIAESSKKEIDIDRMNLFVQEKSKLLGKKEELAKRVAYLKSEIVDAKDELTRLSFSIKESTKKVTALREQLENVDYKYLDSKIDHLKDSIKEKTYILQLKTFSLEHDSSSEKCECALCNRDLDSQVLLRWKKEVASLKKEVDDLDEELLKRLAEKEEKYTSPAKIVSSLENHISMMKTNIEAKRSDLDSLSRTLKEAAASLTSIEQRLAKLHSENKDADVCVKSLNNINVKLGNLKAEAGELKANISNMAVMKKSSEKQIAKLKECRHVIKTTKESLSDLSILSEAFGRYGIPLSLIKNLRLQIEKKATEIFQYFDDGKIQIKDIVERGKPGIEYVVSKLDGDMSYDQLSDGQKVLLYLPVRLAIADIFHHNQPTNFNFLVLDEVTGHLDDKNRNILMESLADSFSHMYQQTFVVAHSSLRNIFDCTIQVDTDGSNSEAHIL